MDQMKFGPPVIADQKESNDRSVTKKLKREPARWVALIGSLITLAMAFGLELTEEQVGAITSVVILLIGEITRGKVTPSDSE